jgi:glycosyltransferase involved in cell wall biosynthesis
MRIVIDLQGAQTESRFRGIGRYTLAFAKAVARNRGQHEVLIALNGLFPDTIEFIRQQFDNLLPQKNIHVWHAPGPVFEQLPENDERRQIAESMREGFLQSLEPDVIHICSLFEGFLDDAVTTIGVFDKNTPVSVTLYDLIPLLNEAEHFQTNPQYARHYKRKLNELRKASLCLAISEHTKLEGITHLPELNEKITSVPTAIDDVFFSAQEFEPEKQNNILSKIGITKPFVLYTGGSDQRKNLIRLVQSFAYLPKKLRCSHQLVLAGKIPKSDETRLKDIGEAEGLEKSDMIFAGFIPDEDLCVLYSSCKVYIFPSWHEGFSLPALEAMACGAPVIAANTSSLPEVIGYKNALFDPFDSSAISCKLQQALTDDFFQIALRTHGREQAKKFSWEKTATKAINAWEVLIGTTTSCSGIRDLPAKKPKLAFVSPLPPERTGIADYSADLLKALDNYYDIVLVTQQKFVDKDRIANKNTVRDLSWLESNSKTVDRVIYQIGNSPYHSEMLELLEQVPGVVVLHDFYLSGLLSWQEQTGHKAFAWSSELYRSHGYLAVSERFKDAQKTQEKFPANWNVLRHAIGIIVHSRYSLQLAQKWYPNSLNDIKWEIIPLVRSPPPKIDKKTARQTLGFHDSDFIVTSFGFLGETKLNHRLLSAWLNSSLASNNNCHLVFVGENHGGEYGQNLTNIIENTAPRKRVLITGFVQPNIYHLYLAASDLAVQLRTQSRGETSAAILDCMSHSLPIIANANGSMAELDKNAVRLLPDEFEDRQLIDALELLWSNNELRHFYGMRAQNLVTTHNNPAVCAEKYRTAIETLNKTKKNILPTLIEAIARPSASLLPSATAGDLHYIANALASNHPLPSPCRSLYIDITATYYDDLKTGIERVAKSLSLALLSNPPKNYRIEPVYLAQIQGRWQYRYARNYTFQLLNCPPSMLHDEPVEPTNGDILIGLDIAGKKLVEATNSGLIKYYRNQGCKVHFMIHDILPIRLPQVFPPNANYDFEEWLRAATSGDGVVCVSETVAKDLKNWLTEMELIPSQTKPNFQIQFSHHGADILKTDTSNTLPKIATPILDELSRRPSFLMVGTIEPRKGHRLVLDAFNLLWQEGINVNLVIVGTEGWKSLPPEARRDIPETIVSLTTHPEVNKRLFWLNGINDTYLEKVYTASACLITASLGEGFGLPLIEAAQHKLPIIARDIPIFREVSGEHAFYFKGNDPTALASSIKTWLKLYATKTHPLSERMPWLTWEKSAASLIKLICTQPKT